MKNKNRTWTYTIILWGLLLMLPNSCKKDDGSGSNTPVVKVPVLTTVTVSNITTTMAASGGNITFDEGSEVTSRGVCWSTNQNPSINDSKTNDGTGTGSFTSNLTGLSPNTIYNVRAYATNSVGTGYGNVVSFTTGLTVTDIDGNVYNTVTIGTQTWMVENLKVTKFNDGTDIPNVTDDNTWNNLITPAYCWYDNDEALYKNAYGALYNWYTVNTSTLCPSGWHVPTKAEWETLISYLGGPFLACNPLKEAGSSHWLGTNYGTNSTGFTALPGGYRSHQWGFESVGSNAHWWTSTEFDNDDAWAKSMDANLSDVIDGIYNKEDGFSVRCLKD